MTRPLLVLLFVLHAFCEAVCAGAGIDGSAGIHVTVDPDGSFVVSLSNPPCRLRGTTGRPVNNIALNDGIDTLGAYHEIAFDYAVDGQRHASIRTYPGRPVVLFTVLYADAAGNIAPFPSFTSIPSLNHLTFAGSFAAPSFGGYGKDSPWVFFDSQPAAFILSPAANFLVANTDWGPNGEINTGISPSITAIPAGFQHQTVLAAEGGINAAFATWGRALLDLGGKTAPPNDADLTLRTLGYWTDNGATYYYQSEASRSYPDTLSAIRDTFAQKGAPLGYVQLDSWFYPKGANADWRDISSGIHQYLGAPALFVPSLKGFQQALGLPLVTHSRWIDASSPYRQQYQISGNVAVDPRYWNDVAAYLHDSGAVVYEQDWLSLQAQADLNLTDPEAFMGNMAASMSRNGINLQYCMASPRHFLQSSKYGNVTSIRTADDRFEKSRWTRFLYASRLASALGVWPFSDVFCSTEADNLLLATLSAGPLGIGDRLGTINGDNLLLAVRGDGVIVKPDAALVPLDQNYVSDVQDPTRPMVASTYTEFNGRRTYYVFAYARGSGSVAGFPLSGFGFAGPVYVYNYFTGQGKLAGPSDTVSEPMINDRAYYIIAPVNDSGMALLGDLNQFVSLGKKRISDVQDNGDIQATVLFAAGETSRAIRGYASRAPRVSAVHGSAGDVTYDSSSQLFRVDVMPDADQTAVIQIGGQFHDKCGDPQACGPGRSY